ncbi:MAG TPA: apolipoprotein N-acyltransferase [Candidatus Krumholzibacteria bacterium]|nr:apolipoprotein N-acyltransferase [Candidatus Krumholzibacteria bacterium]
MLAFLRRVLSRDEVRAGLISGTALGIASPPSWLGPLALVALVPVLWVLFAPSRIHAGRDVHLPALLLSFGLTHHGIELHWLLMLGDASPLTFKWAMPLLLMLLVLYSMLPDLAVFWVLKRIRRRAGPQAIWWFPGVWVMAEWVRGLGEMGFPWLTLGSTQLRLLPVVQIAGVLGELGVSLFVAWVNVLVVLTLMGLRGEFPGLGRAWLSRWWAPATLTLLLGGTLGYGLFTMRSLEREAVGRDPLRVAAIQADVDLFDKWDPAKRDSTFVPYTRMTRAAAEEGARLAVWAETAIPFDLPRRPIYDRRVRQLARESEIYVYTGYVERRVDESGELDSFNSSLMIDDEGAIRARYRKVHLLPLGERMPFQDLIPALGDVDFGQAEWTPGTEHTVFQVDDHRFTALICFESIFSRLARAGVRNGAGFLVNITNDGWFGDTILPHQHAWMAVMRAVENRVPLVRVANNGVSFVARPTGQVVGMTGLFERDRIVADVTPRPGGSFYTRHGDRPLLAMIVLGFLFLIVVGRVSAGSGRG